MFDKSHPTEIPAEAFRGCATLEKVTIPEGVQKIGESAFEECTGLTEVVLPEGLTHIEDMAFFYCTALRRVTLPASLKYVGADVFENCRSLEEVRIRSSFRMAYNPDGQIRYADIHSGTDLTFLAKFLCWGCPHVRFIFE